MRRGAHERRVTAACIAVLALTTCTALTICTAAGAAAAATPESEPESVVVSLGDSYSSGESNPPFDAGTDTLTNWCHRAPVAWPRMLGASADHHFACSGASTRRLSRTGLLSAPDDVSQIARLEQLADAIHVDVVAVTVGGNDVGFAAILAHCLVGNCLRNYKVHRADVDAMARDLRRDVLPAITTAAPGSLVVLVGYPRLFPRTIAEAGGCAWLSASERARAQRLQQYLDKKQAAAANAAGVMFVSVLDTLTGHELCTADPWIGDLGVICVANRLCAHPLEDATRHGQRAIAEEVLRALNP